MTDDVIQTIYERYEKEEMKEEELTEDGVKGEGTKGEEAPQKLSISLTQEDLNAFLASSNYNRDDVNIGVNEDGM
jgi:hypothetical protein